MPIYLILDDNGNVVNRIVWDGIAPYDPGDGFTIATDANVAAISIGAANVQGLQDISAVTLLQPAQINDQLAPDENIV